jgi:stage III sporulation protein AA
VDEIGKREDILAIEEVLGAGISVVSTVHGNGIDDCLKKPLLSEMIREKLFERIIVLSSKRGPCTLENILDAQNDFKVLR